MITKNKQNNNVEPGINHTLLDFVGQSVPSYMQSSRTTEIVLTD